MLNTGNGQANIEIYSLLNFDANIYLDTNADVKPEEIFPIFVNWGGFKSTGFAQNGMNDKLYIVNYKYQHHHNN